MSERDTWLICLGLKKVLEWAEECKDLKELVEKIKMELGDEY